MLLLEFVFGLRYFKIIIKNSVIGKCNSRALIGLAIMI